jgi:Fur family ferric uptake transcriptional regulator
MNKETNILAQNWQECLQANGYRLTDSRRLLVEIMADSSKAITAMQLFDLSRKSNPSLGLVTVYRTLEKLEELSLVQRVHRPNGCHTYLRAPQEHEHLLICNQCGVGFFFSGDDLSELIASVSEQTGFLIQDHWLQLFGVCASCQDRQQLESEENPK